MATGKVIRPSTNIAGNFEEIREMAPTGTAENGSESSESQKIIKS